MRVSAIMVLATSMVLAPLPCLALKVPAGFEELARGQIVWISVRLNGKSVGLYQAKVDLEHVRFTNPATLELAVRKRYLDTPALDRVLKQNLARPLARHDEQVCSARAPSECGLIKTRTLALVYDENGAEATLFLGPQFIPAGEAQSEYYDTPSDTGPAFVHQQNINFVADRAYQSASLQGNGTLGVTRSGFINTDWAWQGQRYASETRQSADVSNAYFRQDFDKRYYLQAGVMDDRDIFSAAGGSINLSQLPLGKINGVRLGSTLAWVNPDRVAHGSPLTVFLTRNARVDAYRGSHLLSTFYLNAGTQTLDTRTFPPGSYPVTLKIVEDNRLVRTQIIPYTGTGGLLPDSFQWFVQGGAINRDNDTDAAPSTGGHTLQAGARFPLTKALSLTAGSALIRTAAFTEGALDWSHGFSSGALDGLLTSRFSYLNGSGNVRGDIEQLNYSDGFSLSLYRSALRANDCGTGGGAAAGFAGCSQNTSLTLSVPAGQWSVNLGWLSGSGSSRYVLRQALPASDDRRTEGAPWQQVYTSQYSSESWQTGVTRTFSVGGMIASINASLYTRRDSGAVNRDNGALISLTLTRPTVAQGGGRDVTSLGTDWQTGRGGQKRLDFNAAWSRYTGNDGNSGMGATLSGAQSSSSTASVWTRRSGQYGDGGLTVSDVWRHVRGGHALSATGNYSSSLVVADGRGALGPWGGGALSSGITLGVKADDGADPAPVGMSVDGGGQTSVRAGSQAAFIIPAWQPVSFNISEPQSADDSGTGSRVIQGGGNGEIFLTPGRVYTRSVGVTAQYTWMGRLTDDQDQPLEGVQPLNGQYWTPLGAGSFSMETSRKVKTLYVSRGSGYWECPLSVKAQRNVIRWVGDLRCKPVRFVSLPLPVRQQTAMKKGASDSNSKSNTEEE